MLSNKITQANHKFFIHLGTVETVELLSWLVTAYDLSSGLRETKSICINRFNGLTKLQVNLSKIKFLLTLVIVILFMTACGKKDETNVNLDDPAVVRNIAHKVLDENIKFTISGYFTSEAVKSIVAGVEISDKNKFGIQFKLIEILDDEFQNVYTTPVLQGSFDKCILDKMKLSSGVGELIYYNSQDFYMGTGGGEIFSYVISFSNKEIYYAHLIVVHRSGATLYLSENINKPMLRKFFISYFKKDYPNLRIVDSDIH